MKEGNTSRRAAASTSSVTLAFVTVLADLHAFLQEHRRCGELESLEGDYVAEAMSITRRPHDGRT